MDTNELKSLVAKHYDHAAHGTGQFLHGDWFTPKHQDSLGDLLDSLTHNHEREVLDLQKQVESAEDETKDIKNKLEAVEEALAA